ncbi:DNA helicase/exodeoxyribonuclease V, subunit A [Thermanaeromonas toyohensis ToBE]|uniref:ATP-dependent helicase/nuclease subunit A n=1 Tax=Thermanaeromonas toyohensis ToBE TaxID=698762 RepID=A0A1W1VXA8_9FIRM|nr:helicase-exonuclease AddAB subunit AddA [Thermanaeromonas toyohensis]SMB97880.1 DNA helicase/exodeoxyribonuclease V, subunit A [Thermanaeromonas toyohensis ToBE]
MNSRWTKEQLEAIHIKGCNLLISAAAGTGKTSVLIQRIINRLLNPGEKVDIDRLLVVTFTQAAASEMRERLAQALSQALTQNPSSRHLRRQLFLLEKANITTLHSFCLDLLRQYFYLLPLPPSFRVMGEAEASLFRQEILERVLEKEYAQVGEGADIFAELVDDFGGEKDDSLLQDLILRLYIFSRTHPWPDHWLEELLSSFTVNEQTQKLDELPWVRSLKETLAQEIKDLIRMAEEALNLACTSPGLSSYIETLEQDLNELNRLLRASQCSWEEFCLTGQKICFPQLRHSPKKGSKESKETILWLRQEYREKFKRWQKSYFNHNTSFTLRALHQLKPLVETLVHLVRTFGKAYQEAKETQGLVDFQDLEHYTLNLLLAPSSTPKNLIPSTLAWELKENFVEVLVDEYQDINPLQEIILQLVSRQGSGHGNLVLIGDIKQSIYRFRWAEPALFGEKLLTYSTDPGSPNHKVNLTTNFRSRPEILHAINFLFRQIMTQPLGEIEYDASAELRPGASYPQSRGCLAGPVELHLIKGESSQEAEEEIDHLQGEARLIAQRIKELIKDSWVWDEKTCTFRPLSYRDIALLLRSPQGKSNIFLEELMLAGIPVHTDTGEGYFSTPEVATILSLLKLIDNPLQDIPLASVLRSPIVGLNAKDLARIRLLKPNGDFVSAVLTMIHSGQDELARRLTEFWHKLEHWRTLARRGRLADLLWRVFRETGYYDFVGALPGGEERQANLQALIIRAEQYEKTSWRGLGGFLRFVERLQEKGEDMVEAQPLSEKENVVRLMSIHKSKGLEFPVVIVAGLGSQFNFKDLYRNILIHKDLGVGIEIVEPEKRLVYPTLMYLATRNRLHREALAEELRILYVALTRAKEKLILVGSVRGWEGKIRTWCRWATFSDIRFPGTMLLEAKNYLDWIVPAVARHRDGEPLRKEAGGISLASSPLAKDPSSWQISIWCPQDLTRSLEQETYSNSNSILLTSLQNLTPIPTSSSCKEEVAGALSWVYPYYKACSLPSKVTVSDLKKLPEEPFPRPFVKRKPRFISQSKDLSPLEVGSAFHLVMQHLDLRGDLTPLGLSKQIQAMVEREILTPEQAASVSLESIAKFFQSQLGKRVLAAKIIEREVPFTLGLPANKLYPELGEEGFKEKVVLQGIIDCLAYEDEGWLLIDYKAERLEGAPIEIAVTKYKKQLEFYALAVEAIYGQKVKDKYLYFFEGGIAVRCP